MKGAKGYTINQRAWFVAKDNHKTKRVEYLDNDRDVFYVEGVMGYATKIEARERAEAYQGDKSALFIIGPNYGRYRIHSYYHESGRGNKNTTLQRFQLMHRVASTTETIEELRKMLHDFAFANGIWCFSNQTKAREFLKLCKEYGALTDGEIIKMVMDEK